MKNSELVRGFFEDFFGRHDLSAVQRYLSPNYIQHDFDVPPGRDGFAGHFEHLFSIFPDFHVNIHHIISEGDMVAVHGYGITNPGEIEVLVTDIYRVEDGLLAEHWGVVQPLPKEQFGNPRLM